MCDVVFVFVCSRIQYNSAVIKKILEDLSVIFKSTVLNNRHAHAYMSAGIAVHACQSALLSQSWRMVQYNTKLHADTVLMLV